MQTTVYCQVYRRLLAEVSDILRVQLCAPDNLEQWVLIEAPSLDKSILGYIEGWNKELSCPAWFRPALDILLADFSASNLRLIRQLLVFCYKIEYEPSDEQLKEAQASFVEVDNICKVWEDLGPIGSSSNYYLPILRQAKTLVSRVTAKLNLMDILPSHGPGAVYPPRKPWNKSMFATCYPTIEKYYPWTDFFRIGLMTGSYDFRSDGATIGDEITCSLVAVPKDSRGPRLICVHPAEAIWIQQGQRRALERAIESHPFTRDQISFSDQTINGRLALESSSSKMLCTLDLKEASDRVSCGLVRYLFGDYQYDILSCTRASNVKLLDGSVHKLQKWAPMGNCLTFPVESLVFWSVVQASIMNKTGRRSSDVHIFGDDIVFPVEHYNTVVNGLVSVGLVPNFSKTFRIGLFRESCGVDAYNGVDITPVRMKKGNVSSIQDAQSWCDLAKALRTSGFEHTASYMYSIVQEYTGLLPISNNLDCSGIVEYKCIPLSYFILRSLLRDRFYRFNKKLHRFEVRHRRISACVYSMTDSYWHNILDSLVQLEQGSKTQCVLDPSRGLEYTVPYTSRSAYGWSELSLS